MIVIIEILRRPTDKQTHENYGCVRHFECKYFRCKSRDANPKNVMRMLQLIMVEVLYFEFIIYLINDFIAAWYDLSLTGQ